MANSAEFGQNIQSFKGLHKSKKLFILASGPSLADHDLTILDRRITMTLNRSCLLYKHPTYQCAMDQRLFEEYQSELKQARYLFTLQNRPWGVPINLLGSEGFSFDLQTGIYSGYTVAYFALQVAVYMGFSTIIYLGLDLLHRDGKTHFFGFDFRSIHHEDVEFPKMIRMLEQAATHLREKEVRLIQCNEKRSLKGFETMSFQDSIKL